MIRGARLLLLGCLIAASGCGKDGDGAKPPAGRKISFWHIQTKAPTKDVMPTR